jgi:hypothetical protein
MKMRMADLEKIAYDQVTNQITRTCGDCHACCVSPSIEELGKPLGVVCQYIQNHQCSIYARRPTVCREFECAWKFLEFFSEDERPDKIGIYVSFDNYLCLTIFEAHPNAIDAPIAQRLMDKLKKHGSKDPLCKGIRVIRFGEKLIEWVPIPGKLPYSEVKKLLEADGFASQPYRRRKAKHRLPLLDSKVRR